MSSRDLNYCRLCAKLKPTDKLLDLIIDEGKHNIVEKLIHLNATIDSFDEKLPKSVCLICFELLNTAYDFVVQVQKAQEVLRDQLVLQKVKTEDELSTSDFDNYVVSIAVSIKEEIRNVDEEIENVDEEIQNVHEETENIDEEATSTELKEESNENQTKDCSLWRDFTCLCAVCDTQFPNISSLHEHSMSFHGKCNSYRCADCRKHKLNLDQFITHVCTHRKHLRLSCYQCSKSFKTNSKLKQHRKVHFSSNFTCRGCNVCFTSKENLQQHIDSHYATLKVRMIPDKLKQIGLTCKVCGKTLKSKATLINHLLIHTNRTVNYVCEVCGKQCIRRYEFEEHMLTHSLNRLFKCNICHSSFKTKTCLRSHCSLHENVKPFECKDCGKMFRLKKQLNSHRVIHSGAYPYKCEVCGKGFNFKSRLQVHERQHSGAMPYTCEICSRAFRDWSNYAKHVRGMHNKDIRVKKNNIIEVPLETMEVRKLGKRRVKNSIDNLSISQ